MFGNGAFYFYSAFVLSKRFLSFNSRKRNYLRHLSLSTKIISDLSDLEIKDIRITMCLMLRAVWANTLRIAYESIINWKLCENFESVSFAFGDIWHIFARIECDSIIKSGQAFDNSIETLEKYVKKVNFIRICVCVLLLFRWRINCYQEEKQIEFMFLNKMFRVLNKISSLVANNSHLHSNISIFRI